MNMATRVLFKAKQKMRTFNCALPLSELEQLKHKCYAKNTDKKSRWGVMAYFEWWYKTIHDIGEDKVDKSIL